MVVFVDLEDEAEPPEKMLSSRQWDKLDLNRNPPGGADAFSSRTQGIAGLGEEEGRVNPNKNAVTEALGCYP